MSAVDPLPAARGFAPELEARAREFEAARRMPAELVARMAKAGLFRLCVPEAYGGLECDPLTFVETIETLARADGSAAWVVFIGATSGLTAAYLPSEAAAQVYADPNGVTGGVFAPRGQAEDLGDGTYRVSGRWAWGSGTENCDWVMGGCLVTRDGKPVVTDGRPEARMFFVPKDRVRFLDTWHVAGLKGTGSTDFEIGPEAVARDFSVDLVNDRPLDRPLYAFPPFGLLAIGLGGVALGLARAAIDDLAALAGAKTPQGQRKPLATRAETQARVAEAEAIYRSARAFLREAIGEAWDAARTGGRLTLAHRRDLRLATTYAVRTCAKAVDAMYELGGGSSVYDSSRLQRCFRDVHVATQHMLVGTPTLELAGRLLLGVEADVSQL